MILLFAVDAVAAPDIDAVGFAVADAGALAAAPIDAAELALVADAATAESTVITTRGCASQCRGSRDSSQCASLRASR